MVVTEETYVVYVCDDCGFASEDGRDLIQCLIEDVEGNYHHCPNCVTAFAERLKEELDA